MRSSTVPSTSADEQGSAWGTRRIFVGACAALILAACGSSAVPAGRGTDDPSETPQSASFGIDVTTVPSAIVDDPPESPRSAGSGIDVTTVPRAVDDDPPESPRSAGSGIEVTTVPRAVDDDPPESTQSAGSGTEATTVPSATAGDAPTEPELVDAVVEPIAEFVVSRERSSDPDAIYVPRQAEGNVEAPAAFAIVEGEPVVADLLQHRLLVGTGGVIALPEIVEGARDFVVPPDGSVGYAIGNSSIVTLGLPPSLAGERATAALINEIDVAPTVLRPGSAVATSQGLATYTSPTGDAVVVDRRGELVPEAEPSRRSVTATIDVRSSPVTVNVFRGDDLARSYALDPVRVLKNRVRTGPVGGSVFPLNDEEELVVISAWVDERLSHLFVVVRNGKPVELAEFESGPTNVAGAIVELAPTGLYVMHPAGDDALVISRVNLRSTDPRTWELWKS